MATPQKPKMFGATGRPKRRAIELYDNDSPFRQKVISKKQYSRKTKYKNDFSSTEE